MILFYLNPKYYKSLSSMKKAYKENEVSGYIDYNKEKNTYTIYTNKDSEEGMYVSSYVSSYLETYNNYLAKIY